MDPETFSVILIVVGLLTACLSLPLLNGKIPMNHIYGVRFRKAFESDETWAEINTYGGKILLITSLLVMLLGAYGFIQNPKNYIVSGSIGLILLYSISCLLCYRKAKIVGRKKANKSLE